jgi:hypothetical protein
MLRGADVNGAEHGAAGSNTVEFKSEMKIWTTRK